MGEVGVMLVDKIKKIHRSLKLKYPRWFIRNGLLSYNDLCVLVELGIILRVQYIQGRDDCYFIPIALERINGSSIDVKLDKYVRVEKFGANIDKVRLHEGQSIETVEMNLMDSGGEIMLMPGAVALASTVECFYMPTWLSAEYSLKSSLGRSFLGHELAGWIDPCFSGKLTLELRNNTQFKKLFLGVDMPIGQVKFFKHAPVPIDKSYAVRGQYNGQTKVQESKGVR
jgi:dCTP deaminase